MQKAFVVLLLVAAAFASPLTKKGFSSIVYDRFWSLDEVYDFMDELQEEFPGFAEVEIMGGTREGRQIRGLRITNEENLGREQLPVIFVTAGKSARDWITVMAAVHLMHELLEHYDENQRIVDGVEWFVLPIANPDGYEFSRSATGDRNWIKNRNPNNGSDCVGVHIERNFEFNWGLGEFSSSDPCNDAFRGPAGDSEEETKTIQFANDLFRRVQQSYVSIKGGTATAQSFVTWPFSSNNELFQRNFRDQISVANIMTDAIWRQTGGRYRTGSEGNTVGFISGTSGDYASGVDTIPFTYTIYTPRATTGQAWMVSVNDINRIVDQIFAGVAALANVIADLGLPTEQ